MAQSKSFNAEDWKKVGRVLKPKKTAVQRVIKEVIGDSDLATPKQVVQALTKLGYEAEQSRQVGAAFQGQSITRQSLAGLLSAGMRPRSGKNVRATSSGYARTR